jgi:tetratricopeptide (TPR) repeat protein
MRNPSFMLLAFALVLPALADEAHHHEMPAAANYGTVHFPTACSAAAQPKFERAVAILHSFGYESARHAFEDVAKVDDKCAMAYWGIAMTQYHGLWRQIWPAEGAAAVEKARARAGAASGISPRELAYIEAIGLIFDDPKTPLPKRELAYEQAMAKLYADYPDDHEAAIFYALALDVTAPPTDKTYANQKKARDILVPIFKLEPNHPGLAHYIIHVSDYPPLAADALPAARRYAQIAPASAHAQHMPSHIFTRLGLWDEAIKSNRASAASAARDELATHSVEANGQRMHALDYLEYAYLQEGRYVDAREVLIEAQRVRKTQGMNAIGGYADNAIPARFAVERHEWAEAAALPDPTGMTANDAITWYAKGLGAAQSIDVEHLQRDVARVRMIVGKLAAIRDHLTESGDAYWANQVEIQRLQVLAWAEGADPDDTSDNALKHARAAADLEDATEKAPVTPGPILPARENLANMLMVMGKQKSAMPELEKVLETSPNRLNTLVALAFIAREFDQPEKAMLYQQKVDELKRKTILKQVSAPKNGKR